MDMVKSNSPVIASQGTYNMFKCFENLYAELGNPCLLVLSYIEF